MIWTSSLTNQPKALYSEVLYANAKNRLTLCTVANCFIVLKMTTTVYDIIRSTAMKGGEFSSSEKSEKAELDQSNGSSGVYYGADDEESSPNLQSNNSLSYGSLNASSASSSAATSKQEKIATEFTADYLSQLLKDKKQLASFPNMFAHLERLVNDGNRSANNNNILELNY